GGPLALRRDFPVDVAGAAQQVHALVVREELQVVEPLAAHLSLEHAAVARAHRPARHLRRLALQRAQALHEARPLRRGAGIAGHALQRAALAEEPGQVRVGERGEAHLDGWAHLAALAVAAVAARAALLEDPAAGLETLRGGDGRGQHTGHGEEDGPGPTRAHG